MNATSAAISGTPVTLTLLPRPVPHVPRRSPAANLRPNEPVAPTAAAAVSGWLRQIRHDNATEERARLALWIVSWAAIILARVSA